MSTHEVVEYLISRVREESLDYLVGLYVTLLQLRFIVRDYDIELNRGELTSILIQNVYSRLFRERAGDVYSKCIDVLEELQTRYPQICNKDFRKEVIEELEVRLSDVLYVALPLYIRLGEVPNPWKDVILKVAENVHNRVYPVYDQTRAGTAAVWEGDLMRDIPSLYDLRLVERYLLVSNIALFGYNVYLVFPMYTTSRYALSLAKEKTPPLVDLSLRCEDVFTCVEQLVRLLVRNVGVRRTEDSLVLTVAKPGLRLSFRVCYDYSASRYTDDRSLLIVLTEDLSRCPDRENLICVLAEKDYLKTALKLVALIRSVVLEYEKIATRG